MFDTSTSIESRHSHPHRIPQEAFEEKLLHFTVLNGFVRRLAAQTNLLQARITHKSGGIHIYLSAGKHVVYSHPAI